MSPNLDFRHGRWQIVDPTQRRTYWLLMAAVLLLLIWPLWEFRYPPLVDYPSHLARVKILREWNRETLLQQRYQLVRRPFPNLAFELLGVYAFSWLEIERAGKVVLTLLVVLFWIGCHLLGRAAGNGEPVWLATIASLLVYNSTFLYGFVNYSFGIAMFLVALPTWLWYRRKRSLVRFLVATAAATVTYLAHLVGIGVLVVAVLFLTMLDWWREGKWHSRLMLDLAPLVPSVMLYASLGRGRGDTHTVIWGSLALKARHMLVCLTTYSAMLTALYSLACFAALLILLVYGHKWARNALLLLGGLLLLLAAIFPAERLFSGSDADARLVVPGLTVTLLALDVNMPRFMARVGFVLLLGVACGRVVEIRHFWKTGDALTRSQLELFQVVPKGARVFPIVWLPDHVEEGKRERHILHATEYATSNNLVFLPQLINVIGQQPVMIRESSYQEIGPRTTMEKANWKSVFRDYDFIYTYRVDGRIERFLENSCNEAGFAGMGKIYRIRKDIS